MINIEEVWKDVVDYEGLYKVSNYSRVWSVKRKKYLKPQDDIDGYFVVRLSKNGKSKTKKTHRLAAIAFIKNPDNLPQINHKDENKHNNYIGNLEWCDAKYNNNYGERHRKVRERPKGKVINFDMKTTIYKKIKEKVEMDNITIKDYITKLIANDLKQDQRIEKYFKT